MAGNDRFELGFGGAMVPAMLDALMIARNTAMLCGSKPVVAEFEAQIATLLRQVGIPNLNHAVDGYKWHAACQALAKAETYHWHVTRMWYRDDKETTLVVDDREYVIEHGFGPATDGYDAVREFVERYARMDATKEPDVESGKRHEPKPPRSPDEPEEHSIPAP